MIVALVSDIHANLAALEAVLADAAQRGCSATWNLGDSLGYGPEPEDVLAWQRSAPCTVSVIGNYDRKVLSFGRLAGLGPRTKSPAKQFAFQWAYDQLSEPARAYLEGLPDEVLLAAAGRRVLLNHADGQREDGPDEETPHACLERLARRACADLVLFGHTHRAFDGTVCGVRCVNPGSVGRCDDGDPRASYATLTFSPCGVAVEFHRIAYDTARVAREVRKKGLPEAFAQMFLQGRSLDAVLADLLPRREPAEGCEIASLLSSAEALGEACHYEERHARQVTRLALRLFDELRCLHGLGEQAKGWLHVAGLLHDIGWIDGQRGHHKAARDIILAAERLPLDSRQRAIVAQIARYHRKALPSMEHAEFADLQEGDRYTLCLLAGLLRLADGLDRSHADVVQDLSCQATKQGIIVRVVARANAEAERRAAADKADLMERAFLRPVQVVVEEPSSSAGSAR